MPEVDPASVLESLRGQRRTAQLGQERRDGFEVLRLGLADPHGDGEPLGDGRGVRVMQPVVCPGPQNRPVFWRPARIWKIAAITISVNRTTNVMKVKRRTPQNASSRPGAGRRPSALRPCPRRDEQPALAELPVADQDFVQGVLVGHPRAEVQLDRDGPGEAVSIELDLRPWMADEDALHEVLVRNREFCEGRLFVPVTGTVEALRAAGPLQASC